MDRRRDRDSADTETTRQHGTEHAGGDVRVAAISRTDRDSEQPVGGMGGATPACPDARGVALQGNGLVIRSPLRQRRLAITVIDISNGLTLIAPMPITMLRCGTRTAPTRTMALPNWTPRHRPTPRALLPRRRASMAAETGSPSSRTRSRRWGSIEPTDSTTPLATTAPLPVPKRHGMGTLALCLGEPHPHVFGRSERDGCLVYVGLALAPCGGSGDSVAHLAGQPAVGAPSLHLQCRIVVLGADPPDVGQPVAAVHVPWILPLRQ